MEKTLGLDLGTNSIGWAIVERDGATQTLLNEGVDIFQEGVARNKNDEKPAVQDRTNARALRRHYFRRRLRKIELLKVLVRHGLCPELSDEDLQNWRHNKIYPLNEEFILWQRTDDNLGKNPYHDRFRALNETLDLSRQQDRHTLGRALYHLSQRRGFLSNRKEASKDNEDGKVKENIKSLTADMLSAGCKYLGEYFYRLYGTESIRGHYTARNEHYLAEFEAICKKQNIKEDLKKELHRAIFFQRPLKSQKGLVGKCTFERHKSRCPISHPRFEEFRMLQFINNIKIRTPRDEDFRTLNQEEFELIEPLFFRKSAPHFTFEDIAKKLAGKGKYTCKGDRSDLPYHFNFPSTTTVSGCPVTAELRKIFGADYLTEICSLYLKGAGKTREEILNDIWHVLFSFEDEHLLTQWAKTNLQLTDEASEEFAKIKLPGDYASLSLNAIHKILPYLHRGYRYDESVFLANIEQVLPWEIRSDRETVEQIKQNIRIELENNNSAHRSTQEQAVVSYLRHIVGVDDRALKRLYHPSMIEAYPTARPDARSRIELGSPRTSSIRNPMAMRTLFRLRALINRLLREQKIDPSTKINIEFARGLNDANKRKAIERYQRKRETERERYKAEIIKNYKPEKEPSDTDILKYQLWEEQHHICLYTGKTIKFCDFIGPNASFDIEHTLPRSLGGDNSQMNKTLCEDHFNRDIKKGQLPASLACHAEIMARIESLGWPEKIEKLEKEISKLRIKSKSAATKFQKDTDIQRRHEAQMELDYWRGKLSRFTMTEVPEGFSNRQGVDIGIIGRYARLYLKTLFEKIYTVKGATTAEFRKAWGLQEAYSKKERINHIHHCIDAITIACIRAKEYNNWTHYAQQEEYYRYGRGARPVFEKPWQTFTEDVKNIGERLLVSHHTPDNMAKPGRKALRIRGKVQKKANGKTIYVQGDTARGVLHLQTFYGAIKRNGETKYVIRKSLDQITKRDIPNIVDEVVRQKIKDAVDQHGERVLQATDQSIWMNEEKRIPIRKVRLFAPSITQPIRLKPHRDLSEQSHKRYYHVANASNYCMGIYEGTDSKGKVKRGFKLVNNLEAALHFNNRRKGSQEYLLPMSIENDYPLKYILKVGTMVLFYEKSPKELYDATPEELTKRLYKVAGMSTQTIEQKYHYGILTLKYHQEAQPAGALKVKNGLWKIGEEYRSLIGINHNQFNALVEGYDFELTVTGEIKFRH